MDNEFFFDFEDQGKIAGIVTVPVHADRPCPAVIYCPGKNGERYEVHRLAVKLARRLASQGIACIRFDYYGMGLSDGHYFEMTTSGKVSNVLKAYQYACSLEYVANQEIAFVGFSDGARIALMAANRTGVKRLVLWSPLFYEIGGNFPNNKQPRFVRHSVFQDKLVMPWAGLWVGMEFYRDLQQLEIGNELMNYDGYSCILYGDDDPLIQEEMSLHNGCHLLFNADERHHVHCVEGAGHLFNSEKYEERLLMTTSAFLAQSHAG